MTYRNDLINARKLYKLKRYDESYNLYTKLYEINPNFDNSTKYSYAWAIYQSKVKNFDNLEDLLDDAELITRLTRQNDLNRTQLCVYTMAVFKVLKVLFDVEDYGEIPHWLLKINPNLLDEVRYTSDGKVFPSRKEKFFVLASKTYLILEEYEKCIEVSKRALGTLTKFTNKSSSWFEWRIAKSLRQLEDYNQALKYLNRVYEVIGDWFVEKEMAENYYALEDYENALKFALKSALNGGPMDSKYNVYSLLYDLLEDEYPEYGEKHQELMDLILDGDTLNKSSLEEDLVEIWKRLS